MFSFFRKYDTDSPYADPGGLASLINGEQTYHLLDVRTTEEYASGHIPTAGWFPVTELAERLPALPKEELVIVYCQSGSRSAGAKAILQRAGFTNVVNFGGIVRWRGEIEYGGAT